MKALKLLNYMFDEENFRAIRTEINEAIAELKALHFNRREWYQKGYREGAKETLQQIKSCEGCEYETIYDSQVICTNKLPCGRDYFVDRYKQKEQ